MRKRQIKIDRLEIRLRRIAPETARSAVNGLGRELLDQLAAQKVSVTKRAVNIARLNPVTLQVAAGAGPTELRTAIGKSITNSIQSKLR